MAISIIDDNKFIKITDGVNLDERYSKENLSISIRVYNSIQYLEFSNNEKESVHAYNDITVPSSISIDNLIVQIQDFVGNVFYKNATERTLSLVNNNLTTVQTNQGTEITHLGNIQTSCSNIDFNTTGAAKELTLGTIVTNTTGLATETTLQSIDTNTTGLGTEVTLGNVYTELQTLNTSVTSGGNIVIQYLEAADYGMIPNVRTACKHGLRRTVTGSSYLFVYQGGVDPYPFPTTNVTIQVSSSSVNDTSAGSGARTLYLEGYTLAGAFQSETISMNGQTGVTLANTYYRITIVRVETAGATTYNEGIIHVGTGTITAGANSQPLYGIPIGYASTFNSSVFIEAGKMGHIVDAKVSASISGVNDKPVIFQLMHRNPAGVVRVVEEVTTRDWTMGHDYCYDFVGPCDLWYQAKPVTPGDSVDVATYINVLIM